ncbi:MAG: hypothetical protein Q8909_17400, partial [Bacteroidota bacterium]|nr:hypothetical protein [Bacteroidota bacterium]
EYQLYSRMGDESRSYSILQTLYNSFPQDQDISDLMQESCIKRASQLMAQSDYTEALEYIRIILHHKGNDEMTEKALEYSITCYQALSRYEEALSTLKILSKDYPDHPSLIEKEALILDKMDRTPEALELLYNSIQNSPQEKAFKYADCYEEIAIPYIKHLTENGATLAVQREAKRLLQVSPHSNPGLHYIINATATLGQYDIMQQYINTGRILYPSDLFFRIKQAYWLNQNAQYQAARELLHNDIDYYRNNKEVIGMFTQSSILYAQQLSGKQNRNEAIAILDTALLYNPGDKELMYNKGLIFEKMRQYDSAYYYQKFYIPAFAEQAQFSGHLRELQYSSSQNEARFSYMQSHYNDSYEIMSVATAEFSHKKQHDSYTFTANYTGRKGVEENYLLSDSISLGGTGIQLQAEWAHQLSKSYNLTLNAAWANRFFPTCSFNSTLSKSLQADMEVGIHIGYKRLASDENLWIAGPTISKNWEKIWANTKLEIYRMQSSFYYNASLQSRLYVGNNKHSNLSMITGIGSAPEISILNNALPSTFSHMNTMVGLGGQYLLSHNLTAGLTGTWYTYYDQTATNTSYKNLYNVFIQLSVAL